jgi:hypothetical protein
MDSQEAKSLRYLGQIVDFRLNYCIEGKNLKIKSSGTKSQKPGLPLPLNVESRDALGMEDCRKKSCIPIQYIETISHPFLMRQKRWIYSR